MIEHRLLSTLYYHVKKGQMYTVYMAHCATVKASLRPITRAELLYLEYGQNEWDKCNMIFFQSGLLVYVLSGVHEGFHFDLSSQACGIRVSNCCHSNCVKLCFVLVVTCITLISVEAERLFQVSILSCFSSCAIQIISPFFSGFIAFSCCFAGILINSLSVINLEIIFS